MHICAVDRSGLDATYVQVTVLTPIERGITVYIHGIGPLVGKIAGLVLAVFAQLPEMEQKRIRERAMAGREQREH